MGRPDVIEEPGAEIRFRLYRMPMVDGDYDTGGAYWGMGPNSAPMWHAYGDGPKFRDEIFLRAWTREEAKDIVREKFKASRFFR